jgi:hypothetical protein
LYDVECYFMYIIICFITVDIIKHIFVAIR